MSDPLANYRQANAAAGGGVKGLIQSYGGMGTGMGIGALGGPVGMLLGSVAGAAIGGIFDAIQGDQNRKQAARQHREAMAMANKQFEWGQGIDRFNMDMAQKEHRHKLSQDRMDQLREALNTDVGLQNQIRSFWARR